MSSYFSKKPSRKFMPISIKAFDLYPEGYDLDSLFVSYKERKLNHDLERGSKKALKNVAADIRKKLGE
jgi:DNA mismatch repair protein MutS2